MSGLKQCSAAVVSSSSYSQAADPDEEAASTSERLGISSSNLTQTRVEHKQSCSVQLSGREPSADLLLFMHYVHRRTPHSLLSRAVSSANEVGVTFRGHHTVNTPGVSAEALRLHVYDAWPLQTRSPQSRTPAHQQANSCCYPEENSWTADERSNLSSLWHCIKLRWCHSLQATRC